MNRAIFRAHPAPGLGIGQCDGFNDLHPRHLRPRFRHFLLPYYSPQNKKQKEAQKMIEAVKKGDKVVTAGGIHAIVYTVKEKTVILKVDDNTKMEFSKSAISSVEA